MSKRNVTETMKKKVASGQKWNCKICANMLDECYEIDHIICIKDGGSNEETNLQALCPNCHRKKTNNDMAKKKEKINTNKEKDKERETKERETKEKEPKEKKEKKETKEKEPKEKEKKEKEKKEKEKKETKEKETKEKEKEKEKVIVTLPVFWNEYVDKNEPYNNFARVQMKHLYPNLVWNKDMKLNGYTIDELKIIHASIQGKFRNGSKKEIMSYIEDHAKKMEASKNTCFRPYGVGYPDNYRY